MTVSLSSRVQTFLVGQINFYKNRETITKELNAHSFMLSGSTFMLKKCWKFSVKEISLFRYDFAGNVFLHNKRSRLKNFHRLWCSKISQSVFKTKCIWQKIMATQT